MAGRCRPHMPLVVVLCGVLLVVTSQHCRVNVPEDEPEDFTWDAGLDVSLLQVGFELPSAAATVGQPSVDRTASASMKSPKAARVAEAAPGAQLTPALGHTLLQAPGPRPGPLTGVSLLTLMQKLTSHGAEIHPQALVFTVLLTVLLVAAGLAFDRWNTDEPSLPEPQLKNASAAMLEGTGRHAENTPAKTATPAPPPAPAARPPLFLVLFFVIGHSAAASTLTLVNKLAMKSFHAPGAASSTGGTGGTQGYVWTLVLVQFVTAGLLVRAAGALGVVKCEPLETWKALAFFPAAGMFMITIVAGNAVMNYSNVNTFLVLRSLVPLPCNISEIFVYNDPLPPLASWISLLVTVGGAVGYAVVVGGVALESVAWAVIYLVTMPIDGLLIKQCISSSNLSSWSLVYYNNMMAALPALCFAILFEIRDRRTLMEACQALLSSEARVVVALSCILGVAISYFQLNTRYYISATAFMVLGVVNKFITVLVNNVFMEHQGTAALLCVLLSLAGAVLWQQTMQWEAVKVRHGRAPWEKSVALPFCLACASLAWAGYIQLTQQPVVHH